MKNYYFYILFLSVSIFSCTDNDLSVTETFDSKKMESRTLSELDEHYYWYKGEKIPLTINPTKRYVVVENSRTNDVFIANAKSSQDTYYVNENQTGYIVDIDTARTVTMSANVNSLEILADKDGVVAVEYVLGDSIFTPISNKFYIKLKKLSDISLLEKYAEAIGCEVEGPIASDEYWIRLSSNKKSSFNSLDASNCIYETGDFADVDPGFILTFQQSYVPSDSHYIQQWSMGGTYGIKAEDAWNLTKGNANITVAVIDGGIHTQHSDLSGRMHSYAYNCDNGSNNPIDSYHGTMVAGIIAANHNLSWVAGVAPNVKLMNISSSLNSSRQNISEELAGGIKNAWMNGADIINNSWGDQGGQFKNQFYSTILENAITDALTKGRNGKGCIVVFASGNYSEIDYPAYCNTDLMVVGSIDQYGNVASNSGRGSALDVVAPGVDICSLSDSGGVSSSSGTSFAAPHVSGLAALILSLNPNLTQSQVNTIIKETASSQNWTTTQGYGRINALAALKTIQKDYSISIANGNGSTVNALAKFYIPNLPKSATVQWSTSSGKATVEGPYSNDSVNFRYNFTGRTMSDEIRATVTYCGMTSSHSIPVTVTNEPKIFGVERIEYNPSNTQLDFKVICSDNNATFVWSGGETSTCWIDFPYAGDASFMDTPQVYKSLDVTGFIPGKTYTLSVTASNQYAWDTYCFEYTHPYSNGMLNEDQEEEEEL